MKISIDRRSCNCWIGSCEPCFSWHYLDEPVRPNTCLLEITEEEISGRTIVMIDRDGSEKVINVTKDNWADLYDGWQLALEAQTV